VVFWAVECVVIKLSVFKLSDASAAHLFGSSEKCLPGVMKTEEPENQVTLVTQTICLAKKCLDLIVDAFHAAVVDPVLPP
jgi:hypothetical protein